MQDSRLSGSISELDSERQTQGETDATKPLPPLPHGWSRVCHEAGLLLRSNGLGIVVTSLQGVFTRNFQEPVKVAIRRSRVTALLRTLIHAVPLGTAIFEIVLNLRGRYVGAQFAMQNYLQFAAKAHEITMQASIATILLSYIRFQISTGQGIPFGAVLGGFQFLQISYLWSSEFWSSIVFKKFQLRRKICFVGLIFVCITIAATAGPSSASLLIARQRLWSIESKYVAVDATIQDIWPDRIDGEKIDGQCAILMSDPSLNTVHCPLRDFLTIDRKFLVLGGPKEFSYIQTPGMDFVRAFLSSPCSTFHNQMCATVPQSGILPGFNQHSILQSNRLDKFAKSNILEGYQILQKNYYQPYTAARCVLDVVENDSDDSPLRFSRVSGSSSDIKKDWETVLIPGFTKAQIINDPSGDSSSFRVHWIDLPQNLFETGIPGAVIVHSQGPKGPPYNMYQCTADAGWGSSALITQTTTTGIQSRRLNSHREKSIVISDTYGYAYTSSPDFSNVSNLPFPERRITVSMNWMNFVNPVVVLADNSTTTVISQILSSATVQLEEAQVARVFSDLLCAVLAETNRDLYRWLSHNHMVMTFNDSNTPQAMCDNCLVFEIENSVYGWLYAANETTTILALTVMLAYCALVLGHIIYSAFSGVSSTAWDSTTELVALTMNSSPTHILQNTCAGIVGWKALKTPVRVLATTQGHLELVFGEVKDPNAQTSTLVMNQHYGKLPDENDKEDEEWEDTKPGNLQKGAVAQTSE